MEQGFPAFDARRRKRHRLLLGVAIVVLALLAVPIAWIGTLTTSYLIRIKSGERISLEDIRGRSSRLREAVSTDVSADDLNRLVPEGLAPEFGNRNARITAVLFLDYECPFSASIAPVIRRVMESEKGAVRLLVRDYPVIDPTASRITANAADCVLEQGQEKYWRFFDELFADQTKRTRDDFRAAAKIAGADVSAFDACLQSRKFDLKIDEDFAFGKKVGVEGTPTMFINRAKVQGAMDEKTLKQIIQRAKEALPQ